MNTYFPGLDRLLKNSFGLKYASELKDTILTKSFSSKTNAFIFFQQVLSQGPIQAVYDIIVDESRLLNDPTLGTDLYAKQLNKIEAALRIDAFYAGSQVDKLMANNFGDRKNASFDNMSYASVYARLDRENPQFSGVPVIQFLIEGKKVKKLIRSGTVENYSYTFTSLQYSNNPAWVLLDYLMDEISGKAIKSSKIDLGSFYDVAQICDEIVQEDVRVAGNIWRPFDNSRVVHSRNLPRYECNIVIDTEKPIRDNVEAILSCIGDARLVWVNGKYKLNYQYPATNEDLNLALVITDDDLILNQNFEISFPDASSKLNHCTVKFHNESENFKEDTASWPPKLGPNPQEVTQLVGLGARHYPIGTASGGWNETKTSGALLNEYSVWDGNLPNTVLTYLIKIPKELVLSPNNNLFNFQYAGDDEMSWVLYDGEDSVSVVQSGSISGAGNLGIRVGVPLGNSSEDRIYRLVIEAFDKSGEQPKDKGSRTKSRGVAFRIIRQGGVPDEENKLLGSEIIWTTREATYDTFVARTVNNYLYRGGAPNGHPMEGFKGFLAEDNQMELETEVFLEGVTDYYHALAKAEELVRTSRGSFKLKFKYYLRDGILEPGDYIKLESDQLKIGQISDLYLRIDSVKINENFECEIEASRFDSSFLAWNVKDDEYFAPSRVYDFRVPAPGFVQYIPETETPLSSAGRLEWEEISYSEIETYIVYAHYEENGLTESGMPVFIELGRTRSNSFILPAIKSWYAIFGVSTLSKNGRESQIAFVNMSYRNSDNTYVVTGVPVNAPWFNAVTQDGGNWTTFPTQEDLGDLWVQNTVVTVNGVVYILTDLGNGLEWVTYHSEGLVYFLVIESSNGNIFRVGGEETTVLLPRLFKNGAEVTEQVLPSWVRWRRASRIARPDPDDDVTWNREHLSGYKTISINIDDIESQATFFCDIIPISPFNAFWTPDTITSSGQSATISYNGGAPPYNVTFEWVGDHDGLVFTSSGNTVTVYTGSVVPLPTNVLSNSISTSETFQYVLASGTLLNFIENLASSEEISNNLQINFVEGVSIAETSDQDYTEG
jgi:hypothetical protein